MKQLQLETQQREAELQRLRTQLSGGLTAQQPPQLSQPQLEEIVKPGYEAKKLEEVVAVAGVGDVRRVAAAAHMRAGTWQVKA